MPLTEGRDIQGEPGLVVGKVVCDSVCLPLSLATYKDETKTKISVLLEPAF